MKVRLTDADITAAIQHADHTAWTRVVDALTPYLQGLLIGRYAIAPALIDDVLQDTWLRAWAHRDQFGRDGVYAVHRLVNWLCGIAVNRTIDGARRQRRIWMLTSVDVSPATWAQWWEVADEALGPEPLALVAERRDQAQALLSIAVAGMGPTLAACVPFLVVDRPNALNQGLRSGRRLLGYERRDSGGSTELAAALGIGRAAAKSRAYRARLAGRQAVCLALGLPPTATLAEALVALDERQEVSA